MAVSVPTTLPSLARRDPILVPSGAIAFGAALVFGALALSDAGWWKPAAFAASIGLYLWTVAWIGAGLRTSRALSVVRLGTVASLGLEGALIALQAARGVPSHFNTATPFDLAVFNMMGASIALATVLAAVLFVLSIRDGGALPAATRVAVPLGLALFLVGTAVGGAMVMMMGGRGVVGPAPGVPVASWDLSAGDLRPAHFVALHAVQVVPAVGVVADGRHWSVAARRATVVLAAIAYGAVFALLYGLALTAQP